MRRWLTLLVLVCGATGAAWGNSVTIGQLQYLGTNAQSVSAFKVILDPAGVFSSQLNLFNLSLSERDASQSTGAITTPTTLLFIGGPGQALPSCPCRMVGLELFLSGNNKPVILRLASGQLFTVPSITTVLLKPPVGRKFLEPGDSAPITLTAVPESGTMALMSTGLGLLGYQLWRVRRLPRRSVSDIS
jgi:hypothetical protein